MKRKGSTNWIPGMARGAGGGWLRAWRGWVLRRAVVRAYRVFARCHPQGRDVLFDEHFLARGAWPVLAQFLNGVAPDPVALATACADQWGLRAQGRTRFIAQLTPLADHFLDALEAELRGTRPVEAWS